MRLFEKRIMTENDVSAYLHFLATFFKACSFSVMFLLRFSLYLFFFFFFFVLFIQIRRSITEDHLLHNKLRASFHFFFFRFFFSFFFSRFHFCFSFYLLFWHYFRLNVDIWCSVTKRVLYSFFQFFFFSFFFETCTPRKKSFVDYLVNKSYVR